MRLFELAVDLAHRAEGHHAARAPAPAGRSPEGQGGLRQGQEDSRLREQQAEEQQAGSQRADPLCVCRAGRGRGCGPGQRAAERGQAPEETREAEPVLQGLLQGPGRRSFQHFFLGSRARGVLFTS